MTSRQGVIPAKAGIQGLHLWTPVFTGVTAFFLIFNALCFAEDPLAENQMRIVRVSGDARLFVQGATDGVEAKTGMPMEPGDQIHTGEDGEVELVVNSHALWVVQSNSDLIIGYTTEKEGRIQMRRGAILGRVDTVGRYPDPWQFETPLAVATVKGTEFALAHSDEEGTHLGVFQGTVELKLAETADQLADTHVLVQANEEGISQKKKPLSKGPWTANMRTRMRKMLEVRKRQRETAHVWSPLTTGYRKELRQKLVPPPPKSVIRRIPPRSQKRSRRTP